MGQDEKAQREGKGINEGKRICINDTKGKIRKGKVKREKIRKRKGQTKLEEMRREGKGRGREGKGINEMKG